MEVEWKNKSYLIEESNDAAIIWYRILKMKI